MDYLRKGTETAHEVRAARIVWAAHILSYLTNNRSHAELHQLDADPGEFEDCASDYETENTVALTGPEEFVRQKILDCIAQLLSPSKGWDFVTAVAVRESENSVVDAARNDSFLSEDNGHGYETRDYCSKLEEYLRTNAEGEILSFLISVDPLVVRCIEARLPGKRRRYDLRIAELIIG